MKHFHFVVILSAPVDKSSCVSTASFHLFKDSNPVVSIKNNFIEMANLVTFGLVFYVGHTEVSLIK